MVARDLQPDSLVEIDRLTRRAKHRQNGIIEKGRSSSREAVGFIFARKPRSTCKAMARKEIGLRTSKL
ncbi:MULTISPECIES: hypothetical protein [Bradyrhizobium]|uniref:Ornithine carbamoyltransferase n=1 Tax=Bradyrhizobium agreste TaxID=2751811 RepID=A0ABS0PUL7_9BRAD|nr:MULTISPECIES: hypothetical protein [Bradyrhizobium]MBH5368951.1 hypothetical protein [Bradyrhizobium glycinis]MBH5400891.1 hypothetical protein [Bradyrhizobium agreste]